MHRPTRLLLASLTVAACLWPVAVSAQAQDAPPGDPPLSVGQLRGAFTTAGYQVDSTRDWGWTAPPVTSFQVHDPASGRVLLVLVYPSVTAAQASRLQAEAHEQPPNAGKTVSSPGPHLVFGYGPSVWSANVAMVQTKQAQLEQLYEPHNARDDGLDVDSDLMHDASLPNVPVDLDFQRALTNSAVDLRANATGQHVRMADHARPQSRWTHRESAHYWQIGDRASARFGKDAREGVRPAVLDTHKPMHCAADTDQDAAKRAAVMLAVHDRGPQQDCPVEAAGGPEPAPNPRFCIQLVR